MGLVTNIAAGVNHSELLDITERSMFGTMPEATEVNHPIDEYVGGVFKKQVGLVYHMIL